MTDQILGHDHAKHHRVFMKVKNVVEFDDVKSCRLEYMDILMQIGLQLSRKQIKRHIFHRVALNLCKRIK